MVSILDIAPISETVEIAGTPLAVQGLGAEDITRLLLVFPQLRKIISDRGLDAEGVQELVMQLPEAVAMIIAAGLGHGGDQDHIAWARKRSAGEQYELVKGALSCTFPKGLNALLDEVRNVQASVEGHGWGAGTKSPAPSNSVSAQGTRQL